jgi:branched-subunit amino acid ABC-type transport system permease component
MTLFVTAVVAGLAIGSIYGLVGIGYTVIFNSTRVFNLAQGDLVMVGVMLSFFLLDSWKMNELLAFVLVVIFVAALAMFEERTVVRPFLKKTGAASFGWFIATLGFSAAIEAVVNALFGQHPIVAIPSPLPVNGFTIGSVVFGYRQLLIIGVFLVVIVLLELFYGRTWLGQAMRGTAEDREAASLRGINPITMSRTAFMMGGVVAAIAGFVIAPITFSDPSIGLAFTLKGFLALAIGGFGSIRGAVVGGLSLGVAEQLFDAYVSSNYEILVGMFLVLLVLMLRPEGLFRSTIARTV